MSRSARALLLAGVAITAASLLALVAILGLYFAEADPHPGLYFTALWGFPLGFTLMIAYMLMAMSRRRRRRTALG
ncbi:hypothetical protein ACFP47_12160 [Nesterenkonia lacusekhoensis]|uniref:Cytochrome c-type biogenesis protein CcmH/NrfF n=1 Tax=Nesterenkonia lacusekhoensis TaxID=150832 RepID=A0ABS4SXZ5_9MICC|nr:hypothetical protein [Nesterenkonia lacusekhoensis]MBP2317008.1 cytochrome c-type biogenesis protein CcmH/NrfF [Nesterenkonia lacusekhoensis]